MKRTELVEKLIKEGFSEKTLVKFSDSQLKQLASRILSEEEDVMISKKDPQFQQKVAANKKLNKTIETYEELKGNQKVLDKNDNGKIDSDDFAILNKEKKGDVKEESKEEYCDACDCVKSKCKCKKDEVNEADMGLTVKSAPKSTPLFGGAPKKSSSPKKKTTPKKKEETTEEGEVDESLHGIMIGATKEKLKKDLGRDPEDHEVEKELNKFVDSWKKDNESKEGGHEKPKHKKKEEEVDEKNDKNKKCSDCGEYVKDCKCDHEYMDESKPSAGLSKEKKSDVVKKAKKGEDIGKKGKGFEKLANKASKEYGSKEKGEKVAAASMWKNIKREGNETKNWVKGLVENKKFHNFTSKNEIMELIQTKLNESETMTHEFGPKVKKGHNGIPEFMSYDAIVSAEPKTAPSKPAPTTKPGTKPTPTRREDPRKTPFQPGPGPNPKPKAKIAEEKKKK